MIPSSKASEKRSCCWFPRLRDDFDRADRLNRRQNDHAWRTDESASRRDRLLGLCCTAAMTALDLGRKPLSNGFLRSREVHHLLRVDRVDQKAGTAGPIGMGGGGTPGGFPPVASGGSGTSGSDGSSSDGSSDPGSGSSSDGSSDPGSGSSSEDHPTRVGVDQLSNPGSLVGGRNQRRVDGRRARSGIDQDDKRWANQRRIIGVRII